MITSLCAPKMSETYFRKTSPSTGYLYSAADNQPRNLTAASQRCFLNSISVILSSHPSTQRLAAKWFSRFKAASKVTLETPKCWATSVFVISGSSSIAAAFLTSDLSSLTLRPPFSTPGTGGNQARHCAFTNQIPFKLCQCSEQMKDQLAACTYGIDVLGQRNKTNSTLFKCGHDLHQVFSDRPNRSSRHTTRESPARSTFRQVSNSGRTLPLPEAFS